MAIWTHPWSFQLPKTFFKILYLSLHLNKDLWGCFLHTIFFIKSQFPSIFQYFVWLSALKLIYSPHYIILSGNCIPVFPQEVVQGSLGHPATMFSSMLHKDLEKMEGVPLDGMVSPSSWNFRIPWVHPLEPRDQEKREIEYIHLGSIRGSKPRRLLLLFIFMFTFLSILCVCIDQEQTMVKNSWKHSSILSSPHEAEGPGSRKEASCTCLDIPGLLKMPLGFNMWRQEKAWGKTSVSEQ